MENAKPPSDDFDLGATVRRIRERQRLTLQEVAEALGIHKSTLSKIESNKQSASPALL